MPTMITVPIGQRTKSIQFGAAYSPSLSFNPDKKLLVGCSGILSGMGLTINTVPNPDQVTVSPGAFIQRGIIVNVTSSQVVETPLVPTFPLFLVAENANEVFNSSVQYIFTTTPAADSVIIASWPTGPITAPEIPIHISNCGLAEAIAGINALVIQHDRQVAGAAQTVFTLPAPKAFVVGANKLQVFRNGKKLVVNDEYAEDSPTQFTLNFGAVFGDIIDILVYQGAPPITSIALNDLTDVTANLANAIKDPSVLRSALATLTNPLATLADIVARVANRMKLDGQNFGTGDLATASFSFTPTGLIVPFTVDTTGPMVAIVGAIANGATTPNIQLGFSLDAAPTNPMVAGRSAGAILDLGISGLFFYPVVGAGAHLIELTFRRIDASSAFANLFVNGGRPCNIAVLHT